MAPLADVFVRVRADTSSVPGELQRGFDKAGADQAGASAGSKWTAGFTGALKRGAMAGALGATGLAVFGLKAAAANEQAQISFETMLGSAEKAGTFLKDLGDFAAKTPFELPQLKTAASSLISVGVNADKVIPIMTSLGNATSGMGTGAEGVQRATRALQQMSQSGRITAEDLNQLTDAGVPAINLLASATGKSTEEIVAMKDAGKLGKQEMEALFKALETGKGLERFSGLMDKQSQSLTGMISTIKDTFTQGLANALTPALPIIKKFIGGANEALAAFFAGLSGKGNEAGAGIGATFAKIGEKLAAFAGKVKSALSGEGADGEKLKAIFESVKDSLSKLVPVAQEFIASLPAIGEVASIGASALKFLADNAGLLRDALPFLVAGFVLYKGAQVAANVASALSIPLQAAQVASNFALAGAIRANAAAMQQQAGAAATSAGAQGAAAATQQVTMFSTLRATAAMVAQKVAMVATTIATKAWAAGQWLLNAALTANPIGLIVVGLAALAGAVYLAWTKSETFRKVVTKAFEMVKGAAVAVFDWVKANWPLLLAIITGPIGLAVLFVVKNWDKIKSFVIESATKIVVFLTSWGPKILQTAKDAWESFKAKTVEIASAVLGFVKAYPERVRLGLFIIIAKLKQVAADAWNAVKERTSTIAANVLSFVKAYPENVRKGFFVIVAKLKSVAGEAWDAVKTTTTRKAGELVTFVKGLPGKLAGALGNLGKLLGDKVKAGIRPVLEFINGFIVDNLNKIVEKFPGDFRIPHVNLAFAKGGVVPGYAPGRDTVPAMLSPGEGILTPQTTRKLGGKAAIEALNAFGNGQGGIGVPDWVKDAGRAAKNGVVATGRTVKAGAVAAKDFAGDVAGAIEGKIREGFGVAVEWLMNPLVDSARANFGGNIIGNMGVGGITKVRDFALAMARGADAADAATGPPGNIAEQIAGFPGGIVFPLPPGQFSVGAGYPRYPSGGYHSGQDFPASTGTPVFSPFSGVFQQRRYGGRAYGNAAMVFGPNGLQFIGGHLSSFARGPGAVRAGEMIGRVGSTGNSTGPHLHAEFRRNGGVLNPRSVLRYDSGGLLGPGFAGINTTRRPERVLTPRQTEAFDRLVSVMEKGGAGRNPLSIQVNVEGGSRRVGYEVADAIENTVVMNGWAG